MFEKWNTFVYELIDSKAKNIEEEPYHEQIEAQMQHLGWAKWRGEICHKENVPMGRSYIQPDIIIKKDGVVQFVIEVKRPVYSQKSKDVDQLVSYIRQLKTQVGIYIGEHIEIFYDKKGLRDNAISIQKIPLELNNKRGARFVEIFSRENFSEDSIIAFCEDCIEEQHRQESLNKIREGLIEDVQQQVTEALQPYLVEKYNGNFSEEEIRQMLSTIRFSAFLEGVNQTIEEVIITKNKHQREASFSTHSRDIQKEEKPRLLSFATLPGYYSNLKSDLMKNVVSELGFGNDISEVKSIDELERIKKEIKKIEKSRNMHNTHSCALSKYIDYVKADLSLQDMEYDAMLVRKAKRASKPELDNNSKNQNNKTADTQRAPFAFDMVGLSKDDKITFDPLGIEVTVLDNKRIVYEGYNYTLSGFCKKFMPENMRTNSDAYQGPKFFSHKGKSLVKIRLEKEQIS